MSIDILSLYLFWSDTHTVVDVEILSAEEIASKSEEVRYLPAFHTYITWLQNYRNGLKLQPHSSKKAIMPTSRQIIPRRRTTIQRLFKYLLTQNQPSIATVQHVMSTCRRHSMRKLLQTVIKHYNTTEPM